VIAVLQYICTSVVFSISAWTLEQY